MESKTVEKVKYLWETWDIRALILTSLIIQALLTLLAPLRKRSSNRFLMLSIWILYLSADAIAVLVIGLISHNDSPNKTELLAFWAPFLLLHLGGPDTITALALEDNELWHRHALQLATQVIITIYVFIQSFPCKHNLLLPTLLMFTDGLIKYFERTCALFFASSNSFRDFLVAKPEPGPNYARLMEEYFSAKRSHIPTDFEGKDGPLEFDNRAGNNQSTTSSEPLYNNSVTADSNSENEKVEEAYSENKMVEEAHRFYEMSKPLLADSFLSLKHRNLSREFFLRLPGRVAFKIIQIELNIIYDVFYTKLFLFKKKRAFVRVFCLILAVASLLLFYFKDRSNYNNADVIITFILLGGAIALDLSTAVMFVMSDWWVIVCYDVKLKSYLRSLMLKIRRWSGWAKCGNQKRWSYSFSQYNLLRRCFRKPPSFFDLTYVFKVKEIRDVLIGLFYVQQGQIEWDIIEYVIEELQFKAKLAEEITVAKEVCSARGNLVLQDDYILASECLSSWTLDVDYDESLLIWHLATDICYWDTTNNSDNGSSDASSAASIDAASIDDRDNASSAASTDHRKFCKALSDYMPFLILRQQTLASALVGMSETRFEDTCAEAKKFVNYKNINISWFADPWWKAKRLCCPTMSSNEKSPSENAETEFFKEFSKKLLEVKADVQPIIAKGDKSKSVLFDACRLAKQLQLFGEKQWEITSKVWVELLCYAAVRCSPRSHIAQLSKGGELITLVWLLMAHYGLGERFLQTQGFGWTKLIIHK